LVIIMKFCAAIGERTNQSTPLLFGGDFIECMKKARDIGFDAVEIHTGNIKFLDVQAIRLACDELDMAVATLGTGQLYGRYGMHLMDEDPIRRDLLVKDIKNYIDAAALLGCKVTIGSIKGNVPGDGERKKYISFMTDCLKEISAYAVKKGVYILLEATNHYENNVLNTIDEVVEIIQENHLENFQVLLDSYHANIEELNFQVSIKKNAGYLGHIHFADNTRCFPGSGMFRFDDFCCAIKDIGYGGILSAECFPLPDSNTAGMQTMDFFRRNFL